MKTNSIILIKIILVQNKTNPCRNEPTGNELGVIVILYSNYNVNIGQYSAIRFISFVNPSAVSGTPW